MHAHFLSGFISFLSKSFWSWGLISYLIFSAAPTTAAPTVTTQAPTLAPANYARNISFKFNTTCTNTSLSTSFRTDLKSQIANKLGISASRLLDFTTKCGSIVVQFQLIHDSNSNSAKTVEAAATELQTFVSTGNFNFTVNGTPLTVDSTSYSSVTVKPDGTTDAPVTNPPVKKKKSGLSGGAVAGIVIAVIIIILIILILVYILFIRKKTRKDPSVEPNDNVLELRGKMRGVENPLMAEANI